MKSQSIIKNNTMKRTLVLGIFVILIKLSFGQIVEHEYVNDVGYLNYNYFVHLKSGFYTDNGQLLLKFYDPSFSTDTETPSIINKIKYSTTYSGVNMMDYIQTVYLIKNKPVTVYSYIYHDIAGGLTNNRMFNLSFEVTKNSTKEEHILLNDFSAYYHIMPLMKIVALGERFIQIGNNLSLFLDEARKEPSNYPYPEYETDDKSLVNYSIQVKIEESGTYQDIPVSNYYASEPLSISYNSIASVLGAANILGKRCFTRLKFKIGNHVFYSNAVSFYYLPQLVVTKTDSIFKPKCPDGKKDLDVKISNIPASSDSFRFVYSIYQYVRDSKEGCKNCNIGASDSIIEIDSVYYFQTVFKSGNDSTLKSSFTINAIPKGAYRLKVYCLNKDGGKYYPATWDFVVRPPEHLINKSKTIGNWGGKQAATGSDSVFIQLNASGGTPQYSYKYDGSSYLKFDTTDVVILPKDFQNLIVKDSEDGCPEALVNIPKIERPLSISITDSSSMKVLCNKIDIVSNPILHSNGKYSLKLANGFGNYAVELVKEGNSSLMNGLTNEIRNDLFNLMNNKVKSLDKDNLLNIFLTKGIFDASFKIHCNTLALNGISPQKDYAINILSNLNKLLNITQIYLPNFSNDIDSLSVGSYKILYLDGTLGKIDSLTFSIGEPTEFKITETLIQPRCYGDKGIVTITIPIGFTYSRVSIIKESNDSVYNGTSLFYSNLINNSNYTFQVKTDRGCIDTLKKFVKLAPPRISITYDSIAVSCREATNGAIQVNKILGGTPFKTGGYNIKLNAIHFSGPVKADTIPNLMMGKYKVVISDSLNCNSDTLRITIDSISKPLSLKAPIPSQLLCSSKTNATIKVTLDKGSRPASLYTFRIENGEEKKTIDSTYTFKNLNAGNYTYRVIGSDNCYRDGTANISVRSDSLSWAIADPLIVTKTSCPGVANGKLYVKIISGYSTNYQYRIQGNIKDTTIISNLFSSNFLKLPEYSNYHLTVTDDSLCSIQWKNINLDANLTPVHFQLLDKSNQYCDQVKNGFIKIKAFTSPGFGISRIIDSTKTIPVTVIKDLATFTALDSLNYRIVAVDERGCKNDTTIAIDNLHNNPRLKFEIVDSLACSEVKNGIITASASQPESMGTLKFSLNGVENSNITNKVDFNNLEERIGAKSHFLSVTDTMGCGSDTSFQFIAIKNPASIAAFLFDTASCIRAANAGARLQATGSLPDSPGYYFVLNNTETLNGANVTFSNQKVGGKNKIVLYDKYGCSDSTFLFSFPVRNDSLNIKLISKTNPACPGEATGNLQVSSQNGQPYADGFAYRVFRNSDLNPVIAEKGPRGHLLKPLPLGNYYVEVTDKDNCLAQTEKLILSDPDTIQLNVNPGYVAAKGASTGWINASASKGNGKYFIEWYKGKEVIPQNRVKVDTTISKSGITLLTAGNYLIRVQDTAKCNFWGTPWLEKSLLVPEPEKALSLQVYTKRQVQCKGMANGEFTLIGSGGWGNSYLFGDAANKINKIAPTFSGLSAKNYTFFVKDTAGVVSSFTVPMTEPETLTASVSNIVDANCFGSADGEVQLKVLGGNSRYAVSTDNTSWTSGTFVNNLANGNYIVYVRDSLDCRAQTNAIVGQPSLISVVDTTITNTQCQVNEGSVNVSLTGGIPSYQYEWFDIEGKQYTGTDKIENLYSGQYRLKVTDAHTCSNDFVFNISDITDLTIDTLLTIPVSCWEGSDGRAQVNVMKGFPPYSIEWPGKVLGNSVTGLTTGNYLLKVFDSEGCKIFRDFTIGTPDSLWINIDRLAHPLCYGVADGSLDISAEGGTPGYEYLWNTGRKRDNISDADTGRYSVWVTDRNGCKRKFDFSLHYQDKISSQLSKTLILCKDNSYPLQAGAFESYKWFGSSGLLSSDSSLLVSTAGKYSLEIQDDRGCIGRDNIQVTASNIELEAQFLMASVINQNDTLVIFESSAPTPDSISVMLPLGMKEAGGEKFYKYIVPTDTGKFEITMISYRNNCQDIISKQVFVLPAGSGDSEPNITKDGIIKLFRVYPNPTDGDFHVDVRLKENATSFLRLVSFATGKTETVRKLSGSNNYLELFQMAHVIPGVYLLNLQVGDEMRNLKVIIR